MTQKTRSTFVLVHPNEILQALVGLKDIRVLHYQRSGSNVELMIEQIPGVVRCPDCETRAEVKERSVVHYVDLPFYGTPMSLAWKKHRMRCPNARCSKRSWVLTDHRIAAKKRIECTDREAGCLGPSEPAYRASARHRRLLRVWDLGESLQVMCVDFRAVAEAKMRQSDSAAGVRCKRLVSSAY
ncbi:MAG: hypothetical protein ABR925_01240 [Acidimicrobiales bacterium]